jgi:hypothetical protein
VSGRCDAPTHGDVVARQIVDRDPETVPYCRITQVENDQVLELDSPDPTKHLKGVDPFIEKVPKQLRPSNLLLARGVPNTCPACPVVTTVCGRRIAAPYERPASRSLMPESLVEMAARTSGDRVCHTGHT